MSRRTQGYLAFGLATALMALAIGVGLRTALRHLMLRGLPALTEQQMPTSAFSPTDATQWVYRGALPAESGTPEWITVSFPDPGAPRISIFVVLSRGEGAVSLLGLMDTSTGRFQAGLTSRSLGFAQFESLTGVVKGPALVNGVPAVWIEAKARGSKDDDAAAPRGWSGVLFAEGFDH